MIVLLGILYSIVEFSITNDTTILFYHPYLSIEASKSAPTTAGTAQTSGTLRVADTFHGATFGGMMNDMAAPAVCTVERQVGGRHALKKTISTYNNIFVHIFQTTRFSFEYLLQKNNRSSKFVPNSRFYFTLRY